MVVGVVQEVFRALAGDLNHSNSRSVSRLLRSFFSFSFAFVYCIMSRLMKLYPFLGACAAALDEKYVSTFFCGHF